MTNAEEDTRYTSETMCRSVSTLFSGCITLTQISLIARDGILMCRKQSLIDCLKSSRNDLQEILEHVVTLFGMCLDARQRITDAKLVLKTFSFNGVGSELLLLGTKAELVDDMSEVVMMSTLEIWYEIVYMHRVGLERAARGEVEVADTRRGTDSDQLEVTLSRCRYPHLHLIHLNLACDIAAFASLLLQLLAPTFLYALYYNEASLVTIKLTFACA
jgi:hypothetical protein